MEHNQHLNGEEDLIEILSTDEGKLRSTSRPTVSSSSWENQVKKIAYDFKCLTQHAFEVPAIQIQACSLHC